jgi:hypothetical protein
MSATPSSSAQIANSLAEFDFNRSPRRLARLGPFKQWSHTTVMHPQVAVMANFSSLYGRERPGQHQFALILFGPHVQGVIRRIDAERCHIPVGRGSLRFDRNEVVFDGSEYRLELSEPALRFTASIVLRASARASLLQNVCVGGGGFLNWAVVPRLLARGVVRVDGSSYELADVPAYRDRNWGTFAFGSVTWDFGYAIEERGDGALVFSRIMDRTRTRVLEQAVMVWGRGELLATFRDHELAFCCSGWATAPTLTIPPALRVCCPGSATDVPALLGVNAASARGSVEIAYKVDRIARVAVPNDSRHGLTLIHEAIGNVAVTGNVEGHRIRFEGPGFMECVRG